MIKRPRTILISFLCFYFNYAHSQTGNIGIYNNAVMEMVQADKLYQDTKNAIDAPTIKKTASAYKKAGDDFVQARTALPGLDIKAAYYAAYCYYYSFIAMGNDNSGNELVLSALQQWPQLNHIPYKKLVGETKVKDGGQAYSIKAAVKEDDWYKLYYSLQENATRIFYESKSYQDAIYHADTVIHQNYKFPLLSGQAADYAAKSYHALQMDGKSTEYTITGLQRIGEFQAVNDKEKEAYKTIVNSLIKNLETFGDIDPVFAANAAIAMAKVSKYGINVWDKAKKYGYNAYSKGQDSKELLFALADIERGEAEDNEVKKWIGLLQERRSDFNREDYNHLALEYNYLHDGKDAGRSIRRGKKYENRQNTAVAITTNPFNYFIWHDYPFSLDLIRPHTAHELRISFDNNTPYAVVNPTLDTGSRVKSVNYTGYEISYTIKHRFPSLSGKKWLCPYTGLQFRYTYRKFNPTPGQYYSDTSTAAISPIYHDTINATSQQFDVNIQFGEQIHYKRFFADLFTGIGVGYRTLVSNIPSNPSNPITYQGTPGVVFNPARWNTVYIPLRLGFRVGIIL